jgi:hypothetical protein
MNNEEHTPEEAETKKYLATLPDGELVLALVMAYSAADHVARCRAEASVFAKSFFDTEEAYSTRDRIQDEVLLRMRGESEGELGWNSDMKSAPEGPHFRAIQVRQFEASGTSALHRRQFGAPSFPGAKLKSPPSSWTRWA